MGKGLFTETDNRIKVRRFFALILAIVLFACSLPAKTVYATELGDETVEDAGEEEVEEEAEEDEDSVIQNAPWESPTINGSSDPTLPALTVEEMAASTQSTPAEDNLYALTVATGITPGDTVHYFAVRYTDNNGAARTKYLFPHEDAYKVSFDYMSEKGGTNEALSKRHEILNSLGYTINEPSAPTALSPWSVDEYLFKADYGLTAVNSIEVFMSGGSWAVQGMTVSKVTSVAGYGEYGFYSGKYFFGLGKTKIAQLTKKKVGALTLSANGDTLINIGGSSSAYFDIEAVKDDGSTSTPFDDLFTIRMDFMDSLDSGLESYMKTSANDISIASADLVEDIAVELEYKDKNQWTRKVTMPVVLSAVGQSLDTGDDIKTFGLCQRGDTIAFTGCMPDLSTVVSTKVYVGSAARDILKTTGGLDFLDETAVADKAQMVASLDEDDINLSGMSIYQGTCRMSNINNGADSVTGEEYTALSTAYSFSEPAPFGYYTIANNFGFHVNAGGQGNVALKTYNTQDPLIAANNSNKNFLVRLHTDSMDGAATTNNIYVQITYDTSAGNQRKTERYDAQANVQELMGYWPTMNVKKGNFAYTYGTRPDGTLEFPIEMNEVTGISNIAVFLGNGSDDWQMSGVSIAYVPEIGPRRVYLRTVSAQGESSPFQIVRTMEKADIPPFPLGIKRHFNSGESDSWDVATGNSTGGEELDFNTVRYSMNYEQTQMNWGFVNVDKRFDVTVTVADDSDSSNANGDSGSNNQFYFQLLFKNGNSAVVLANQQLSSDGFRAGYNENFTISVNRDYGALTGVRIIPEDISEDSEIFDKLNISKIVVTEQSNGGSAMQYIIDSVGWIGIDYHDKAEDASIKGREGRLMSELSNKYNVSYQRSVVNLLCEVMTLQSDIQDYLQVQASICCDLTYIDTNGQPQTASFDVINRMAQYMEKDALSYEAPGNPTDYTAKYYKNMTTISDPEWMLRPNHTDRFILPSIPNLQSIKSMTFYATSRNNKPGEWVIGNIAISQIIDDGPVLLTADNEYYRDMTTIPLCRMVTNKEKVAMLLPAGAMQNLTLDFSENQLVWNDEESWVSPVTRIPDGAEDTMNIFVYPSENSRNIDGTSVDFAAQYAIAFENPQQQNGKLVPLASGTESACFVAYDVRGSGMATLNSLTLRCMNPNMLFDHAIVQQIREGVVVSNYYINFNKASALLGVTAKPSTNTGPSAPRQQTMYLSFGTGTAESTLFAEENDVAVSFKYHSTLDFGASEYYSPYVYLTDAGIGKLTPGLMAEIPFDVPYVADITGYRIVSFGGINATVEGAVIANYSYSSKTTDEVTGETITNDLTRLGVYSMVDITGQSVIVPLTVVNQITEKPVSGEGMVGDMTINPIDITFTTAGAMETGESGTQAPVQMTFNYYDQAGAMKCRIVPDIRAYIQGSDKSFRTGMETRVRLFLPECKELLAIQIQPYDDSGTANWTISNISGSLGFDDYLFNRMVNNRFVQGKNDAIYIKEVVMTTYFAVHGGATQTVTNHESSVAMNSGERINVSVVVADGTGFSAKANWIVNGIETDVTGSCIKDLTGTGFYLIVPKNTTSTPQTFQIVVASLANPSVKDVISIAVNPIDQGSANDIVEQLKKEAEESKKKEESTGGDTSGTSSEGTSSEGEETGTGTGGESAGTGGESSGTGSGSEGSGTGTGTGSGGEGSGTGTGTGTGSGGEGAGSGGTGSGGESSSTP